MKEHNQFRLRLNLFDGIVLVLALAAAVFLLWRFTRPAAASGDGVSSASVQYTVRFQRWPAGSAQAIHQGDQLADNIKNYDVGTVVNAPAQDSVNLVLTIQGEGLISEGRYQLNRIYDLGINASRNFYTPYAQFTGTITSIG